MHESLKAMPAIRDSITGTVYRRPLSRPAEFVASRRFPVGNRSARRGFLVATDSNDQGQTTEFGVYADVNRNQRYDRRDVRIGEGLVMPGFVGGYESHSLGVYGTFSASLSDGTFAIVHQGDIVTSAGVLF